MSTNMGCSGECVCGSTLSLILMIILLIPFFTPRLNEDEKSNDTTTTDAMTITQERQANKVGVTIKDNYTLINTGTKCYIFYKNSVNKDTEIYLRVNHSAHIFFARWLVKTNFLLVKGVCATNISRVEIIVEKNEIVGRPKTIISIVTVNNVTTTYFLVG